MVSLAGGSKDLWAVDGGNFQVSIPVVLRFLPLTWFVHLTATSLPRCARGY
jgi:hypothetical protein